jgi:hypothetical protein
MHISPFINDLKEAVRWAATTLVAVIAMVRANVAARLAPIVGDDRGEIASWVVVTALVVVASIAIVGVIVSKLTTSANNIQTP